jgi:hypothetical protein
MTTEQQTPNVQRPTSNVQLISLPCRAVAPAKVDHLFHDLRPIQRSVFGVRCSVFSSLALASSLFAIALFMIAITASAQVDKTPAAEVDATPAQVDEAPYFGNWENDRGESLQITSDSIKINDEKPARYDDITEDSDESLFFVLQIKDSNESSYFGGIFLRITFGNDPDHFTMSIYKTLPDTLKQQNEVKHIEWSVPAVEKEETDQTGQPKEEQPKGDQGSEKATSSPSATPSPSVP